MAFYKCAKPRIIILWKTSGQQNDVAKSAGLVRNGVISSLKIAPYLRSGEDNEESKHDPEWRQYAGIYKPAAVAGQFCRTPIHNCRNQIISREDNETHPQHR